MIQAKYGKLPILGWDQNVVNVRLINGIIFKEFNMDIKNIILSVLLVLSFVLIIYAYPQERKLAKTYLDLTDFYKAQVDTLIELNNALGVRYIVNLLPGLYFKKLTTREEVEYYFATKHIKDFKAKFYALYTSLDCDDFSITNMTGKDVTDEQKYELILQIYLKKAKEHNSR